jgi:hypothetical protein
LIRLEYPVVFQDAVAIAPDALWPGNHNFVGGKCG